MHKVNSVASSPWYWHIRMGEVVGSKNAGTSPWRGWMSPPLGSPQISNSIHFQMNRNISLDSNIRALVHAHMLYSLHFEITKVLIHSVCAGFCEHCHMSTEWQWQMEACGCLAASKHYSHCYMDSFPPRSKDWFTASVLRSSVILLNGLIYPIGLIMEPRSINKPALQFTEPLVCTE